MLLPEYTYFISRDKLCHVAFTGTMLAGGRYRRFIHWWCNRQCMSLQLQGRIRILIMAVSIVARAHPIILCSHFYNSTPPGRSGYPTTPIHWQNWNWLLFVHSLSGDLNVEFVIWITVNFWYPLPVDILLSFIEDPSLVKIDPILYIC